MECWEIRDGGKLSGYVIRVKAGYICYQPGRQRSLLKCGLYTSRETALASFIP